MSEEQTAHDDTAVDGSREARCATGGRVEMFRRSFDEGLEESNKKGERGDDGGDDGDGGDAGEHQQDQRPTAAENRAADAEHTRRRAADGAGSAEVKGGRRRHIARRRVHLVQHVLRAAEAPPHPPAGDAVAGGAELAETSDEEEEAEVPHQQVEADRLLDHERSDSEANERMTTVHLE